MAGAIKAGADQKVRIRKAIIQSVVAGAGGMSSGVSKNMKSKSKA